MRENIVWDDALAIALWQLNRWQSSWRLFVQDGSQLGLCDDLLENGELGTVQVFSLFLCVEMLQIQRPDANLRDFKGIENIHGDSICPLIGEMAAYSATKTFKSLAHIDWFPIIDEEGVNTPLYCPNTNRRLIFSERRAWHENSERLL